MKNMIAAAIVATSALTGGAAMAHGDTVNHGAASSGYVWNGGRWEYRPLNTARSTCGSNGYTTYNSGCGGAYQTTPATTSVYPVAPAAPVYQTVPTYSAAPVYNTAPTYSTAPVYNTAPTYSTTPVYNTAPTYQTVPSYNSSVVYSAAPRYNYGSTTCGAVATPGCNGTQGRRSWVAGHWNNGRWMAGQWAWR